MDKPRIMKNYGVGMTQGKVTNWNSQQLSSSGQNVKVKSELGPEIGFVMG